MKPFMQLEGKARDYLVTILLRINYNFEISPEMTQDCYFDLTHILYVDLNYQDEEIDRIQQFSENHDHNLLKLIEECFSEVTPDEKEFIARRLRMLCATGIASLRDERQGAFRDIQTKIDKLMR